MKKKIFSSRSIAMQKIVNLLESETMKALRDNEQPPNSIIYGLHKTIKEELGNPSPTLSTRMLSELSKQLEQLIPAAKKEHQKFVQCLGQLQKAFAIIKEIEMLFNKSTQQHNPDILTEIARQLEEVESIHNPFQNMVERIPGGKDRFAEYDFAGFTDPEYYGKILGDHAKNKRVLEPLYDRYDKLKGDFASEDLLYARITILSENSQKQSQLPPAYACGLL